MDASTGWAYRQQVLDMMRGYRPAQVLIACTELGVFDAAGSGGVDVTDLAQRLDADAAALARLLNAAVAVGLLHRHGATYANSPIAMACLAADGPFYLGNLVTREGAFYRRWSRLTEAVRTGQRPQENVVDERQTNWVRDFELALYDLARTAAPAIAEALGPLLPQGNTRRVRVLDVGGGHGAYSIALAQRYRNVEAVVFDLPPVAEVAREIVANSNIADRVQVQAGDFKIDEFDTGYDLALLFGILVSEPPADAVALLHKVHAALTPNGLVIIRGFYLEPDRTGPVEASLFDLHMLLSTGAGAAHTIDDVAAWLHASGFEAPATVVLPAPERSSLLVARKLAYSTG